MAIVLPKRSGAPAVAAAEAPEATAGIEETAAAAAAVASSGDSIEDTGNAPVSLGSSGELPPFAMPGCFAHDWQDPAKWNDENHQLASDPHGSAKSSYLHAVDETTNRPNLCTGNEDQNKANLSAWLTAEIVPKMQADGWAVSADSKGNLIVHTREDNPGEFSVIDCCVAASQSDPSKQRAYWNPVAVIGTDGVLRQPTADGSQGATMDIASMGWSVDDLSSIMSMLSLTTNRQDDNTDIARGEQNNPRQLAQEAKARARGEYIRTETQSKDI